MERVITVCDVDLDVEYDATPYRHATWNDPAEGGEVEITGVCLEGNDVIQLLSDWTLKEIQTQLERIDHTAEAREERACAAESYAESRRDDELTGM